jgi:hypothetical protein
MVLGSMAELVGLPVSKDHDNFDIYMKLGGFSYTTFFFSFFLLFEKFGHN